MTTAMIIASALAMASASRLAVVVTLRKISAWVMIKSLIAVYIDSLVMISIERSETNKKGALKT